MRKAVLALAPKRDVPLAAAPRMSRRARRGDRRAREALAEKHACERKDDGAESCPDENRLRVARRRAHRRPQEALRRARGVCRRREGREDRRSHALGQHGDNLRPEHGGRADRCRRDLAEEARASRARRQKQAHRHNDRPSRSRRAQRQSGPDRAPANADGRGERRRRRAAPTRARPMRRPRPKSTKRGRQAESEHRRARRGSTQGPSAQTACG